MLQSFFGGHESCAASPIWAENRMSMPFAMPVGVLLILEHFRTVVLFGYVDLLCTESLCLAAAEELSKFLVHLVSTANGHGILISWCATWVCSSASFAL